jgi:hypothetical protein
MQSARLIACNHTHVAVISVLPHATRTGLMMAQARRQHVENQGTDHMLMSSTAAIQLT